MRTVTFLAQYGQIRNFTKHIFKNHRTSCHNLFVLGKRGLTRHLTLQEDHNVSICNLSLFWASGPKYGNQFQVPSPQKRKILSLFLRKFNWQYDISKIVSLSMRSLPELNLCECFCFEVMRPNMENRPQFTPKELISILLLPKFYWQWGISKKVSLSIRRSRDLNLYRFF